MTSNRASTHRKAACMGGVVGLAVMFSLPAFAQTNQSNPNNLQIIQPDLRQPAPYQPPNYPQPERMPMPPVVLPPHQAAPPPPVAPPPALPR